MGQVMAEALEGRDAAIWGEWVSGLTQAQIAERRGLDQTTVSAAVRRYAAAIPEQDKTAYRERILSRYEELYQAHRQTALERPRVAAIVRGILDSQARVLGLVQSNVKVEHDGQVGHVWEPGPSMEQILDRWREEGKLRVKGELTRMDG
jgi:hypothetical protein